MQVTSELGQAVRAAMVKARLQPVESDTDKTADNAFYLAEKDGHVVLLLQRTGAKRPGTKSAAQEMMSRVRGALGESPVVLQALESGMVDAIGLGNKHPRARRDGSRWVSRIEVRFIPKSSSDPTVAPIQMGAPVVPSSTRPPTVPVVAHRRKRPPQPSGPKKKGGSGRKSRKRPGRKQSPGRPPSEDVQRFDRAVLKELRTVLGNSGIPKRSRPHSRRSNGYWLASEPGQQAISVQSPDTNWNTAAAGAKAHLSRIRALVSANAALQRMVSAGTLRIVYPKGGEGLSRKSYVRDGVTTYRPRLAVQFRFVYRGPKRDHAPPWKRR